jgi:hypothetical protein
MVVGTMVQCWYAFQWAYAKLVQKKLEGHSAEKGHFLHDYEKTKTEPEHKYVQHMKFFIKEERASRSIAVCSR